VTRGKRPVTSSRGERASRGIVSGGKSSPERGALLATKLHPPALRHKRISRPALVAALAAGVGYKLTLLDAPAGWGKTTVLAQWIAQAQGPHRFAWLSLDPADNDLVCFWDYVIAALRHAEPKISTRTIELLGAQADPHQVVLPALLNDLGSVEDPIVLVLDDYHLVTNPAIHAELAFVIDRMPTTLRVVLATRSDPPLPLARLRAGGDLLEIRADDLRFAISEAALLLNDVLGLDLADEEVALLYERTEGWAAGLYLAALSLQGRPDADAFIRAFAGNHRHIVDYLSAEVLDGQPQDLRTFMLRTSILGKLSGPLCDAVLQSEMSAAILQQIERDNLFLMPLDSSRHWYRYHHLFGELLRSELRRTEPGLVPALHRRAAAWFHAQGATDNAVHHLAAAGDVPAATEIIAAGWGAEYDLGHLSTVSGWLDLLPGHVVAGDPRLCLARAWIALDFGQLQDAGRWIEAVAAALATGGADGGTIQAELAVLQAVQRFKIGDVTAAVDAATQAISLDLGDSRPGRSAAYCIYGATHYWSGSIPEAWTTLSRAAQLADEVSNDAGRTYALGYLAVISAERGRLEEAERLIYRATSDRDAAVGEHFVDMMVSLAMAMVFSQRGETVRADEAARRAVVLSHRGGGRLEVADALLTRARILQDLGDRETAEASLEEARTILRQCRDPGLAGPLLTTVQSRLARGTLRRPAPAVSGDQLTSKEFEVLRLLATPLSRGEIGAQLYVSVNTVKTHQRALYRKLQVTDRAAAVGRAKELGLLEMDASGDASPSR
jgi:LuxR family transcriptional regulator, maltose regulon positive regulatory protein